MGAEGSRKMFLDGLNAALAVVGSSLAEKGVELLGLTGKGLTSAAAKIGEEVAEKAGESLSKKVAIEGVKSALDGAFSGSVSEAAAAFTDERTWRRGVWEGLLQVGQSALVGGLTGLATGAVIGAAMPGGGRGLRKGLRRAFGGSFERGM